MSTPDPQTARDFARRAILSSAEDVDFMGIAEQFSDDENWPADDVDAEAMHDAVEAERQTATVTVSWPDEQQPADPVSGEQQDGAAGRLRHLADVWAEVFPGAAGSVYVFGEGGPEFRLSDLCAVLDEREADMRAVAEACSDFGNDEGPRGIRQLYARYADRIAAQAADAAQDGLSATQTDAEGQR